ncbi:RecX family transcriptional regulator [Polynucleobacter sp. Latsch14-2]|jgi:regulatory protein|nr:RecX family transcriptional regulator [Polynucleobacter sp. Latsch14-2]
MSELGGKTKQSPSLKARALRLLSLREYSRKELAGKLEESAARYAKLVSKEGENESAPPTKPIVLQIQEVLDDFEARGWLSDDRFAEALVRRRSERYGVRKIQDELQRAGVDGCKTVELIQGLRETEYQRAKELWLKKFGVPAQEQKERARQYRFLASKGFSSEVVSKVLGGRFD